MPYNDAEVPLAKDNRPEPAAKVPVRCASTSCPSRSVCELPTRPDDGRRSVDPVLADGQDMCGRFLSTTGRWRPGRA